MKTKQVNYAYPTSTIANQYNMPDGCWTVEIGEGSYYPSPMTIVSVHKSLREAVDAAYIIDLPFCGQWLECAQRNK